MHSSSKPRRQQHVGVDARGLAAEVPHLLPPIASLSLGLFAPAALACATLKRCFVHFDTYSIPGPVDDNLEDFLVILCHGP